MQKNWIEDLLERQFYGKNCILANWFIVAYIVAQSIGLLAKSKVQKQQK